jgi:hypothetical protein
MKRKIIFFSLLTVAILGALFVLYLFRPVQECVCKVKAQEEVAATELVSLYENDEDLANQTYLGKVISVEGTITLVTEDGQGRKVIELDGESLGMVSCTLCSDEPDNGRLTPCNHIKIKGECAGFTIDVILIRCCIVS